MKPKRPPLAHAALALGLLRAATGVCCAEPAVIPPLAYMLPAPGSYRLEHIMQAPDGAVLDSDGSAHRLAEFTTGKLTLFAFIYTYCSDARGCPLAYETMHRLKQSVLADPAVRGGVRFVSMSFDPGYDTPAAMRAYGGEDARERGPLRWHFLTTRSAAELVPVLDGFGQDATIVANGQRVPVRAHMLKVFLIDRHGSVREIYTPSFLHPDVLLNDLRTLALEKPR